MSADIVSFANARIAPIVLKNSKIRGFENLANDAFGRFLPPHGL
jgi:hypothetical protein